MPFKGKTTTQQLSLRKLLTNWSWSAVIWIWLSCASKKQLKAKTLKRLKRWKFRWRSSKPWSPIWIRTTHL